MRDADAILFVVDGSAGLLPEDESIARELRKSDRPIALVVNKMRHAEARIARRRVPPPRLRARARDLGRARTRRLGRARGDRRGAAGAGRGGRDAEPDTEQPDAIRVARGRSSERRQEFAGEPAARRGTHGGVRRGRHHARRDRQRARARRDGVYVLVDTAGLRRQGRRDRIGERTSALMAVRSLERADVALVVTDAADGFTDQDAQRARARARQRLRDRRAAQQVGPRPRARRLGARARSRSRAPALRGRHADPRDRREDGPARRQGAAAGAQAREGGAQAHPDRRAESLAEGGDRRARARHGAARNPQAPAALALRDAGRRARRRAS